MLSTTVEKKIFETIKQVVLKEEFELKNLAGRGIYYMPEQAFFYQVSKALLLNKQLIFGESEIAWLRETKVGDCGVVDLLLKVEREGVLETYIFQFKFRDDYEAYLRDAKTLLKIRDTEPNVKNPRLFLCGLVDTVAGESDERITTLEANMGEHLHRVDDFLVMPTRDEIHRKNVQCVICLWQINR